MRRAAPYLLLGLVLVTVLAGRELRAQLGIELSPDAIREWVLSLGWKGPVAFVAMVVFRHALVLPSWIILSAGGLAFGAVTGTLLGSGAIVLSATLTFGVSRVFGRAWLRPLLGRRFQDIEARAEAASFWAVGLTTAHPFGPMSPFHCAAGLSVVPVVGFVLAVAIASPVRAGAFALLGSSLVDWSWSSFVAAALGITAFSLLPLLHRGLRERIRGQLRALRVKPG